MTDFIEHTNQPYPPATDGTEKEFLPSSLSALIISIASLLHMAFLGWIPAIIALNHANKALQSIEENPDRYTEQSISMANAGKKMAVIGLILGILGMFATFLYYYWIFTTVSHFHYYQLFH
jgi:hypothetical protein